MLFPILHQYVKTKWDHQRITNQTKLQDCQKRRWHHFKKTVLPHSPFYKEYIDQTLEAFPIINKSIMMAEFDTINTVGLKKERAFEIALQAEYSRNFSPMIHGITIGFSSGTSGQRGLFLASTQECAYWVGSMLAKALPHSLLHKESIAFFLRANSNLYQSLGKSHRLQFHYFDLTESLSSHYNQLNCMQPSIISAPATVLLELAGAQSRGFIQVKPHTLFSVAEVLEPMHQTLIESVFGVKVKQIYQCTEGFLGISNQYGYIQLNEENLIIEKEWLDTQRFIPIITDLKRKSQPIIRYRLDDVLITAPKKSSPFSEIASIEGREGDICMGLDIHSQQHKPIFADVIRQALARTPVDLADYQIKQTQKDFFEIATLPQLDSQQKQLIEQNLNQVFIKQSCQCPTWNWTVLEHQSLAMKRRRISCMSFPKEVKR